MSNQKAYSNGGIKTELEKDDKIYTARENKNSWTLELIIGKTTTSYNVKKADYPTFDDLKAFIAQSDLF